MSLVSVPYDFVGGTRAIADQVDANFAALVDAINTNVNTTLQEATTFYVSTTGADITGNGTSATTPAATITWLYSQLQHTYDLNNQNIVIQLANGIYNESVALPGPLPGQSNWFQLTIQGNSASPSLVTLNGNPTINCTNGAMAYITGCTILSSTSNGLQSHYHGRLRFDNIIFGATPNGAHLFAARGGTVQSVGNYTISGSAATHGRAGEAGGIFLDITPFNYNYTGTGIGAPTITLTGTPAFSTAFLACTGCSTMRVGAVFTGTSATGVRALAHLNGAINLVGQGATYLPGSLAYDITTGGQVE